MRRGAAPIKPMQCNNPLANLVLHCGIAVRASESERAANVCFDSNNPRRIIDLVLGSSMRNDLFEISGRGREGSQGQRSGVDAV